MTDEGPGVRVDLVRVFPVAWVVQGDDDAGAEVVWAATEAEASAIAEGDYGTSAVKRAEWADVYEPTRIVPLKAFVDNGFTAQCYECGEDLLSEEPNVWDGDHTAFCTQDCMDTYREERARNGSGIAFARAVVLGKWPNAKIRYSSIARLGHCKDTHPQNKFVATVTFSVPGMADSAEYCLFCNFAYATLADSAFLTAVHQP